MTKEEIRHKIEDLGSFDRDELDDDMAEDQLEDLLYGKQIAQLSQWLRTETGKLFPLAILAEMTIEEIYIDTL